MIRDAKYRDIPQIVCFVEKICPELGYPFDAESVALTTMNILNNGWYLRVYEQGGEILGLGGITVMPHYTDYRSLQAVEFVWNSKPGLSDYRRGKIMMELFEDMHQWTSQNGLPLIIGSRPTKNNSLFKYLSRKGQFHEFFFRVGG